MRTFPTSWTDYPVDQPESAIKGQADFQVQDLQMLAKLLANIDKV